MMSFSKHALLMLCLVPLALNIASCATCGKTTEAVAAPVETMAAPAANITPVVSRGQVPIHLLGGGMAEVQVMLDRSKGLSSAALSYFSAADGWAVPEHQHPDADELLYILEGSGELTLNGEKIQVSADSAIFIPRNAPHSFVSGPQGLKALQVYTPGGPEQRFLKAPTKTSE